MPIVKRWSDYELYFTDNTNTVELSMKRDENAIVRSVQYLLLTDHYERPFHPEIGSNLRKQLFEPMTYATVLRIRDAIIECLNNFEPRVQLTNVEVNPDYDRNSYDVSLRYYILNEEVERQTRFLLERTR